MLIDYSPLAITGGVSSDYSPLFINGDRCRRKKTREIERCAGRPPSPTIAQVRFSDHSEPSANDTADAHCRCCRRQQRGTTIACHLGRPPITSPSPSATAACCHSHRLPETTTIVVSHCEEV
nr:hypothetical protein Iba_scaffold20742CG0040 [Ipomoea batatas]